MLALRRRRRPAGVADHDLLLRRPAARGLRADRSRPRRQDQGHLGGQGRRAARGDRAGGAGRSACAVRDDRRRRRRPQARAAIGAGECPDQPDQVDDVVAHRALLHARLELLLSRPPGESPETRGPGSSFPYGGYSAGSRPGAAGVPPGSISRCGPAAPGSRVRSPGTRAHGSWVRQDRPIGWVATRPPSGAAAPGRRARPRSRPGPPAGRRDVARLGPRTLDPGGRASRRGVRARRVPVTAAYRDRQRYPRPATTRTGGSSACRTSSSAILRPAAGGGASAVSS